MVDLSLFIDLWPKHQRLFHMDLIIFEIDVSPLQSEQLTNAHAGVLPAPKNRAFAEKISIRFIRMYENPADWACLESRFNSNLLRLALKEAIWKVVQPDSFEAFWKNKPFFEQHPPKDISKLDYAAQKVEAQYDLQHRHPAIFAALWDQVQTARMQHSSRKQLFCDPIPCPSQRRTLEEMVALYRKLMAK